MTILHHDQDTMAIAVKVVDKAKQVVDVSDANFEVFLRRNQVEVVGSVVVTSATDGLIRLEFQDELIVPGWWNLQCRMTKGAQTDTILSEKVQVRPSPVA